MRRAAVAVAGFAMALGASTVLLPLAALADGLPAAGVGAVAGASAAVQLLTRLGLPALLRRVPDRTLMVVAALVLGGSSLLPLGWSTLAAFAVAQGLQGAARALFWTANQTHAVRLPGIPVRRLAQVQMANRTGRLVGTAGAGLVAAVSFPLALVLAAGIAGGASVAARTLSRLPTYPGVDRATTRPTWRRRELGLGAAVASLAGGWRGLMDSFVPVVLDGAGLGAGQVGLVLASGDGASLAATGWLAWRGAGRVRTWHVLATTAAVGLCGGLIGWVGASVVLAMVLSGLGGVGGGTASVHCPILITDRVDPDEQGPAIAMAGAYRAGARLAVPAFVATVSAVVGVPLAMTAVAALLCLPPTGFAVDDRRLTPADG